MTLGTYRMDGIVRKSQTKQNFRSNEQSRLKHNTGVLVLSITEFCGVPGSCVSSEERCVSSQQVTFMTEVKKIPLVSRQQCLHSCRTISLSTAD